MDTIGIKHWSSKTGALMWIDDHYPEYEDAEPVHIGSVKNHQGWIISRVWGVRLASGAYVTGQEEG